MGWKYCGCPVWDFAVPSCATPLDRDVVHGAVLAAWPCPVVGKAFGEALLRSVPVAVNRFSTSANV